MLIIPGKSTILVFLDFSNFFLEFMVASLDRRNLLTDNKIEACFKLFDKVGKFFKFFLGS